jgi:hypothetical protein
METTCSGVRPSSAATKLDSPGAPENTKHLLRTDIAAPEDGRTSVVGDHDN